MKCCMAIVVFMLLYSALLNLHKRASVHRTTCHQKSLKIGRTTTKGLLLLINLENHSLRVLRSGSDVTAGAINASTAACNHLMSYLSFYLKYR